MIEEEDIDGTEQAQAEQPQPEAEQAQAEQPQPEAEQEQPEAEQEQPAPEAEAPARERPSEEEVIAMDQSERAKLITFGTPVEGSAEA